MYLRENGKKEVICFRLLNRPELKSLMSLMSHVQRIPTKPCEVSERLLYPFRTCSRCRTPQSADDQAPLPCRQKKKFGISLVKARRCSHTFCLRFPHVVFCAFCKNLANRSAPVISLQPSGTFLYLERSRTST
jgi:hypothetical protein